MSFPSRRCLKCHAILDKDPSSRRRYCDDRCAATARKRRQRGHPESDGTKALDSFMAELQRAATTVQDQALTIRALERTIERLQEQANERDRLRYAANVAELNADKRITQHGHALAATRREVDNMAERIRQEHDRLRDQNATLRDALTRSDLKNGASLN